MWTDFTLCHIKAVLPTTTSCCLAKNLENRDSVKYETVKKKKQYRWTSAVWEKYKKRRAPVVAAFCYGINHCQGGGNDNKGLDMSSVGQQCMSLCIIWVSCYWECMLWSVGMCLGHLRAAVMWMREQQKAGSEVSYVCMGGGEEQGYLTPPSRTNGSKTGSTVIQTHQNNITESRRAVSRLASWLSLSSMTSSEVISVHENESCGWGQ